MPSEDTKIIEFNQYQKSDKAPFIIYADLESIIEKIDGWSCKIIYTKSKRTCSTSFFNVYNIIILKLLTKEQNESYENVKIFYNCKEKIENEYVKD